MNRDLFHEKIKSFRFLQVGRSLFFLNAEEWSLLIYYYSHDPCTKQRDTILNELGCSRHAYQDSKKILLNKKLISSSKTTRYSTVSVNYETIYIRFFSLCSPPVGAESKPPVGAESKPPVCADTSLYKNHIRNFYKRKKTSCFLEEKNKENTEMKEEIVVNIDGYFPEKQVCERIYKAIENYGRKWPIEVWESFTTIDQEWIRKNGHPPGLALLSRDTLRYKLKLGY